MGEWVEWEKKKKPTRISADIWEDWVCDIWGKRAFHLLARRREVEGDPTLPLRLVVDLIVLLRERVQKGECTQRVSSTGVIKWASQSI
mgnify:CR=1 FL=1|jgi:hypothetical protein|tara:strand:- start:540 stop:803 length:264 start_codon:yes stop_codon:yes gene_type:complete